MRVRDLLLGTFVLAGCLDQTDGLAPDPTDAIDLEGTTGTVRVDTPDGSELLHYIVRGGHAIYQDDIDLGPVAQLKQRGGAARLGERWPNSTMFFRFDPNFSGQACSTGMTSCVDVRARVRDTLAAMALKLPVKFVEDTGGTASNYVLYRFGSSDEPTAGLSDAIGMDGGEQHITFRSGHAKDTTSPPIPFWNLEPSTGTIRHETLHALGLWHEQSRADRDTFVTVHWGCIDPDLAGNYDKQDESADVGPYDFNSIMHYSDTSACIPFPGGKALDPDGDGCSCKTMTPNISGAFIGTLPRPGGFSIEDANTVFRMYAKPHTAEEASDHYGSAVAIGDFDGDGYDDLAVGIPDEDREFSTGTKDNAGAVMIYKGTSAGPIAWDLITEQDVSGSTTADARFGAALVALDINADGLTDLAVGAPQGAGGAGAVFVFEGTQTQGLVGQRTITQSIIGFSNNLGDRFGEALAAGPVTGLVRNDGCGGTANTPYDALVIGAPGNTVNNLRTGSVYVVHEFATSSCGELLAASTRLLPQGSAAGGDDFGAAVAVGELNNDGKQDIVVGAPHHASDAGAVYTYGGRLPPESSPLLWSAMATAGSRIDGGAGTKLGSALAIGNLVTGGGNELVMGAPGGTGRVKVMNGGGLTLTTTVATLTQANPEAGDEFGAAVAIGNVDRADTMAELVVGAPGENSDAGAISIFRSELSVRTTLLQRDADVLATNESGDRFGAVLAIGNLDGRGRVGSTFSTASKLADLAIGVPHERSSTLPGFDDGPAAAGAVTLMRGATGALVEQFKTIDQRFSGQL